MNITIVIVTYNRLEKLTKTLICYDNLFVKPKDIIVVNNNSTDGTKDYLEKWRTEPSSYGKHILHLPNNIGGSGGFYEGQKYALSLNPDWIMLADDDAYPQPDMIECFEHFVANHNTDNISAICSAVLKPNGVIDTSHRSSYRFIKGIFYERTLSTPEDYEKQWFNVDLLSYVGCFIKRESLLKAGLVNPDYFIYCDDTEHSIRLKKEGEIVCVPKVKIIHDDQNIKDMKTVSWKDYYGFRNEIDMLKRHYPIAAIAWSRRQLKVFKNNPEKLKIYKTAMKDAWRGRLGIHELYKPGWTSEKP